MGKINLGRVILGGLLAGLIISISEYVLNTYVMAADTSELLQRLGLAEIGTKLDERTRPSAGRGQ